MQLGDLRFHAENSAAREGRIFITTNSDPRVFRVDLTRFGSAIEGEMEAHPIEGDSGFSAVIKSATKELLLLQKAYAFLLRRAVKARDAYDIHLLKQIGATLGCNLQAHFQDTVLANEVDSDSISGRMKRIDVDLCRLELKPMLPGDVYSPLEEVGFGPLRDAIQELYVEWL